MDTICNNRHGFRFHTTLFPALMQGDEAPGSIIAAMERIYDSGTGFDCVVLIRGGGSKADLESFNQYDLAYFITQFPLPVITGIGHERDESVADMVAHHALKTPTAVAEFLVDQLLAFEFRLSAMADRLSTSARIRIQAGRSQLDRIQRDLLHLSRGLVRQQSEKLLQTRQRLEKELAGLLERKHEQLAQLQKRTELVDPVNILKRGYSITLQEGRSIDSVRDVEPGSLLETRLYQGTIISKVKHTSEKDDQRED